LVFEPTLNTPWPRRNLSVFWLGQEDARGSVLMTVEEFDAQMKGCEVIGEDL
jgi:hypothetical protein